MLVVHMKLGEAITIGEGADAITVKFSRHKPVAAKICLAVEAPRQLKISAPFEFPDRVFGEVSGRAGEKS